MGTNQLQKKRVSEADSIIGNNLKNIRLLKGLSQKELGGIVGLTFQQIQKYENGTNRISAARLIEFSNGLDVSLEAFYDSVTKKPSQTHFSEIKPEVLRVIKLLNKIEDKGVIKQIEDMSRIILEGPKSQD